VFAKIRAVEGQPGRMPIDPRILVALWLYAIAEGVGARWRSCCPRRGILRDSLAGRS